MAALALLLVALAGAVAAPTGGTAGAQDQPSTTIAGQPPRSPDIIPSPNSGREPRDETDRGGWAQYAVLGGIVAGIGLITVLIVRESRRKRAALEHERSA